MRIRSLEITGFKSFADRVVLSFDRGLSAIVGPNGCGKSNVVDAIRWVMGEQNPRHLRGRLMEDIIFGGTEAKAPVGMAEVVMTLDNSDGLAKPPYDGFSEIQIARRLYRSGESDYLINKTPVRLRDVTDFFLDTGLGTRGYTIVEQGKIAELVSTKPEERRIIFEEAAGIGKYRQRRRETERKLDGTEQNLLRVTDILGELRRQINSLDRQARKAARYKEISARVRDLELAVTWQGLQGEQEEIGAAETSLEQARAAGVALDARVSRAEATLQGERRSHLERERTLQQRSERLFSLRSEIQSLESSSRFERREREGLLRLAEERGEEIRGLEQQLTGREAELQQALRDLAASEERLLEESGELASREEGLRAQAARVSELQGKREASQQRLVRLAAEAATLESRRDAQQERRAELELRVRKHDEVLEATSHEADEIEREETSQEGRLRAALSEQDQLGRALGDALRSQQEARQALEAKQDELSRVRGEVQQVSGRLEAQREAEKRESVRAAQVLAALPGQQRRQVRALLSEVVRVAEGLEPALEAVLAGRLDAVLVQDGASALELLATLRREKLGRATALAPGSGASELETGIVPLGRPLMEYVEVDDAYRGVVERLVRGVYLIDDIAEAVDRFGTVDPPAVFVTREGEILDRSGALTGGASPAGALSRQAEIRRLDEQAAAIQASVQQLEVAEGALIGGLEELERELDNTRNRRHTAELAVVNLEKDLERTRERSKTATESVEAYRSGRQELGSELERVQTGHASAITRLEEIGRERAEADSAREQLGSEADTQQRELSQLEQRLVEARVELAELGARRDQLRENKGRLDTQLSEAREWLERRRQEVARAQERAESLAQSVAEAERKLTELIRDEESLRQGQDEERARYEEGARSLEEMEQEERLAHREREQTRERIASAELALQELRMRRDQACERILEKYGVDLRSYRPPDEQLEGEPASREAELGRLRQSLQSMGEVHLGAIEEYEEVSERHRFLSEQKADLEESIEKLKSAISRINRTSRTRFRETFEKVDAEFQRLFPRMFRGGRAHITLTEAEDVLEAGIEIHAQPPGKKLQNVNLLSGGEKSLTALSLLFAVFKVKPSPFFLLDEVDAALDDANVGRFDELLRELATESQFLVITHNKASIESADTLFGVTMQQLGVSKLVTVDLVA